MEMFLYEGISVIFQLALAYFKLLEKQILASNDFSQTFLLLQNVTRHTDWREAITVCLFYIFCQPCEVANEIKISTSKITSLRERYYNGLLDRNDSSIEKEVRMQKR
jgi:hypothetical protein